MGSIPCRHMGWITLKIRSQIALILLWRQLTIENGFDINTLSFYS
jgi:hypothetical protein